MREPWAADDVWVQPRVVVDIDGQVTAAWGQYNTTTNSNDIYANRYE